MRQLSSDMTQTPVGTIESVEFIRLARLSVYTRITAARPMINDMADIRK